MQSRAAVDGLRATLWVAVGRLERGDWRAVLRPPEFRGGVVAGPRPLVDLAVALRLTARSMQLQAQGRLHEAWQRLAEAADVLPEQLLRRDHSTGVARAVLAPEPPDEMPDFVMLAWRTARLVWREQFELDDLRRGVAPGRVRPRDELVEACVQHLFWVEFDHCAFYRVIPGEPLHWDDGTMVDRLRSVLCLRATRLRQFADPAAGRLSQAVWQDIGGYRGLCASAFDRLAARAVPVSWCGLPATTGLLVRRGRLRAWQHARRRREDLSDLADQTPTTTRST
jgi:hypothetical protein